MQKDLPLEDKSYALLQEFFLRVTPQYHHYLLLQLTEVILDQNQLPHLQDVLYIQSTVHHFLLPVSVHRVLDMQVIKLDVCLEYDFCIV